MYEKDGEKYFAVGHEGLEHLRRNVERFGAACCGTVTRPQD